MSKSIKKPNYWLRGCSEVRLEGVKRKRGNYRVLLTMLAFFLLSVLFIGMNSQKDTVPTLTLNETNIILLQNANHHIFVIKQSHDMAKENVTNQSSFSTSDSLVANVDRSGMITAVNEGVAIVTVSYEGMTKTLKVTVKESINQINVREFGAKGNGETDDTKAFQEAIDDLARKGGGELYVPEGTYILHPIFLKPHVSLVGESRDSVTLRLADDEPTGQKRLINMNDFTKVQNITCDGNFQNLSDGTEHMHCIFAYDSDHLVIDQNRLMNAVGDGISISGSKKASDFVVLSNNIVEENQRAQIVIEQANHVKIINNVISSSTGRSTIHFEPWEEMQYFDAEIFGNSITSNVDGNCVLLRGADSQRAGIGGEGYFYHGIVFYQNHVSCPSGIFLIEDTLGAKVYDNQLNVRSVKVWRKNEGVKIYQNEITAEVGVRIEGGWDGKLVSSGTEILQNTFYSSNEGILIQAGAQETNILQNKFIGSGKKAGVKLFITEDIENTMISKNEFKDYDRGLYFEYYGNHLANKVKIQNNLFEDLKNYALYVKGPVHHVEIDENKVINSSGMYVQVHEGRPMSNINILNNTLSGGEKGIVVDDYGDGVLKGLTIKGNRLSHLTNGGSDAAIELKMNPIDVLITENELINNENNTISFPKTIYDSVRKNKILSTN